MDSHRRRTPLLLLSATLLFTVFFIIGGGITFGGYSSEVDAAAADGGSSSRTTTLNKFDGGQCEAKQAQSDKISGANNFNQDMDNVQVSYRVKRAGEDSRINDKDLADFNKAMEKVYEAQAQGRTKEELANRMSVIAQYRPQKQSKDEARRRMVIKDRMALKLERRQQAKNAKEAASLSEYSSSSGTTK